MKTDLYDTVEKLDIAIAKINYILLTNKAYTKELLEDYFNNSHEIDKVLNGLEYVNEEIVKEFQDISTTLITLL